MESQGVGGPSNATEMVLYRSEEQLWMLQGGLLGGGGAERRRAMAGQDLLSLGVGGGGVLALLGASFGLQVLVVLGLDVLVVVRGRRALQVSPVGR